MASNLLLAVGSDLGARGAGPELLAIATFETGVEFLLIIPFLGALDKATWAYKGWGLGQSGSR